MKKKNIVIIIIIVAILIGIITFLLMQNSKQEERKYSIENVEEFNYYVLQDGENYGVIDKNAKIIVEPKFQNIVIPNPSKPVFICTPSDGDTKVYNENGEQLFSNYDEINYIKLKNIASNLMYEKSVLVYKKEGKYGLIDYKGKEITKPNYGSIDSLGFKEGELIAEQDGKYGVININGVNLVDAKYETIQVDGYYTEKDGYKNAGYIVGIKTEEGYRYGYVDVNGNTILDTEFNEITRVTNIDDDKNIYFIASKNGQFGLYKNSDSILNTEYQSIEYNQNNNIFILEKSRKFGFADINGKLIVDLKYSQIDIAGKYIYVKEKEGNTLVLDASGKTAKIPANVSKLETSDDKYNIVITDNENQTLYGVEDQNGEEKIPNEYTYIEYLFDNYFIVCNKEGLLGVIDDENNVKIELNYNSIQSLKSAKLIQATETQGNITTVFNSNFEKLCEISNASMKQIEDYIKIYNDDETYYISNLGKLATNKEVYPNNKLLADEKDGKWGFVDTENNVKINYQYDRVTEFNEYGYAGICQNGKWGVINSGGKIIQEPKYDFKDNVEPTFLGKYYQVTYGFGEIYFSNK